MKKRVIFLLILPLCGWVLSQTSNEKNKIQKVNVMKSDTVFVERIPLEKTKEEPVEKQKQKEKNPLFGYDFFSNNSILFTPDLSIPTPSDYVIGSGDQLLIEIWGAAENSFSTKVDNQGNIFINGVGKINISGLTFNDALTKINSHLKKIFSGISAPEGSYQKVYTSVSLEKVRSISVNIIGEVNTPGTYTLNALSNVLGALYASGGPSQTGSFREVKLIRQGKEIAKFDIYKYLLNGDITGNLSLQNQDLIIVPAYKNHIIVEGQVKRPGIYEMLDDEPLEKLIGYFGGFLPDAYTNLLILERTSGSKRMLQEISEAEYSSFPLKAGDKLSVRKLDSDYSNKVEIVGAVYQPGIYQLQNHMNLNDLIQKANGLKKDAHLDKVLIFRGNNTTDYQYIAVSLKDIINKKVAPVVLQNNDKVQIFSENDFKESRKVRIEGAVNHPQIFDFVENMTVSDVISLSGGLKSAADRFNILVSRQLNTGKLEDISQVYNISTDQAQKFRLEPNDVISVRYIKGYTPIQTVEIKGEIAYPGVYSIQSKNETIYDLIDRAGGLSPFANKKGITLIRKNQADSDQVIVQKDSSMINLVDTNLKKNEYSIGISLDKKHQYPQIILKEGDVIVIPEEKQTVQVKGLVLSPSLIQYKKGMSALECVNRSGGFANNANKKALYVIYANGSIKSSKNYLLFTIHPSIEPGAIVVVPEKAPSTPISLKDTATTLTALTTLGILIYNTFK